MTLDLTNPIFHDEDKAREHLESVRWPNGPFCPHCGEVHNFKRLQGKSHRAGLFHCNSCEQAFTVTVGSVMERSKIPLTKWVLAYHLMAASKKGMSSKQLQRMLGISYKSAWFLTMRIREAMKVDLNRDGPIGGEGKIVESDETFVGGKKKNVHKGKPEPKKHAVHALVERGGEVRAKHVADVTAKTLREAIVTQAHRKSEIHTDEALTYYYLGKEFAKHRTVNHSQDEYFKDGAGVQSAEAFFALIKRAVYGTFHSISEAHLQRYVDEAAFKFNNRSALGIEDAERARNAIRGGIGRRLTYRQPHPPADA
jgi:transposase-like protein